MNCLFQKALFQKALITTACLGISLSVAQKSRPTLTPREASQKAEERFGGKALSAEPQNNGKPMYKVKIIQEGRVKTVLIPAGQ